MKIFPKLIEIKPYLPAGIYLLENIDINKMITRYPYEVFHLVRANKINFEK